MKSKSITGESILRAIWDISDERVAKSETRTLHKSRFAKVVTNWRIVAPAAAASLVIAFAIVAQPWNSGNTGVVPPPPSSDTADAHDTADSPADVTTIPTDTTSPTDATVPTDTTSPTDATSGTQPPDTPPNRFEFVGLPTRNVVFNGSSNGDPNGGNPSFEYPPKNLTEIFNWHPRAFVFAKVIDAHVESGVHAPRHTVTIEILEDVAYTPWHSGGALPRTMTVDYSVIGENPHDTAVLGLREGGIYLLPLVSMEYTAYTGAVINAGQWGIIRTDGALFEVGDTGNIWSHSRFSGFNQFDGRHARELAQAIINLVTHADYALARTDFGIFMAERGDWALAEVIVTSNEVVVAHDDRWQRYQYTLDIVNIYPNSSRNNRFPATGSVQALAWDAQELVFENNGRYFVFLYFDDYFISGVCPDEGIFIFGEKLCISTVNIARVNRNGRITAIPQNRGSLGYYSLFTEFNGRTPAQIADAARRARAWHEMYS
jgi:hypothetical protein